MIFYFDFGISFIGEENGYRCFTYNSKQLNANRYGGGVCVSVTINYLRYGYV